jgi:hypothetical protein
MSPELVVALALGFGVLAQTLAHTLRIPGIVLLLATGLALGPEGLGWIQPGVLGQGLYALVSLSVAVILFEGALNLDVKRLRREGRTIRALVTSGALITWVGGAIAAHFILGWDWRLAILFGAMVIVTGPTVINPLLRSLRVKPSLATVLEAAGVAALESWETWVPGNVETFRLRRDAAVEAFAQAGFQVTKPKATLYLWIPVPGGEPSEAFARRALEQEGVIILPGASLGAGGEGYFRVALTVPEARLAEAAGRLGRLLAAG